MNKEISRPERYINNLIDIRAKQATRLTILRPSSEAYLEDALYYDVLANDPDRTEAVEEDPKEFTLYDRER